MINTYCLTCRKKTLDLQPVISKSNNKTYVKSKCGTCGKKKSKFVSKKQVGGKDESLLNKGLKQLKTELHLIDQGNDGNIRKMSFCGPGTDLKRRLNDRNQPQPFSRPINQLDWGCLKHDLAYRDHKDLKSRNYADSVLDTATSSVLSNPASTKIQKATALLVKGAMKTKTKLQI